MGISAVTGATGFIGGQLVEWLSSRGEQVRCLIRSMSPKTRRLEALGAKLVQGDLHSEDALRVLVEGCDAVYHAAGANFAISREALFEVNEAGTRRLAAAAAQLQTPPTFLLISSAAAAGPTLRGHRRSEDEPPRPISQYGSSKLAGEQALREFAPRMPATVVRPGVVFGPGNRDFFPVFRMIHVDDLIELMSRAVTHGERLPGPASDPMQLGCGIYNACDEVCPDWRELGEMLAAAVGRRSVIQLPLFVPVVGVGAAASQLWQAVSRRPNVFNLDKIREATASSWACSGRKAFGSLQFEPESPLQQRLDETARWYFDNGWLKPRQSARSAANA